MWKIKLPLITIMFFIIISLPFLLGMLTPSIHEGNFYSIIYVIINIVPFKILGRIIDLISVFLFKGPTLYQTTIVSIIVALVFWTIVAYIAGVILDRQQKRRKQKM